MYSGPGIYVQPKGTLRVSQILHTDRTIRAGRNHELLARTDNSEQDARFGMYMYSLDKKGNGILSAVIVIRVLKLNFERYDDVRSQTVQPISSGQ